MPDSKFEEKGKSLKRGLQNTLALRVVMVTIFFLVLPIIVLSCILYFHEYDQKKKSNYFALNLIAHEIQDVVTNFVEQNETVSETLSYVIRLPGIYSPAKPNKELNKLLTDLSANNAVSNIIYVQRKGEKYYCTIASNAQFLGKDFSAVFSDISFNGQKEFFLSHRFFGEKIDTLITAYPLYSHNNAGIDGVFLIFMSPELFSTKIEFATNNHFPISTSIITDHGRVVASTREDFLQRRFALKGNRLNPKLFREKQRGEQIILRSTNGFRDNYTFEYENDTRVAVYLPLQDTNYGILIEMSNDVNLTPVGPFLLRMVLLFAVIFLSGIIGAIWLTLRIVRPLRNLCLIMLHAQRGNRHERYKKDRWGFEINVVGEVFNSMLDAFEQQVKDIRRERDEKEMLAQELLVGQKIQTSLLPISLPQVPSLQIATGFISAKEVGGDYYDVFMREKNGQQEVLFSIADVSGKGVYACLFSLSMRSIIRSYFMKGYSVEDILKDANNLFYVDAESSSAFVTLWLGIYEVETKKIRYANCGHFPALHTSVSGEISTLHTANMALGVLPLKKIETAECQLQMGEGIFLYTDGIIEAPNREGEFFGEARVHQIVQEHRENPQILVNTIIDDIHHFSKGVHQHDDITMLSIRLN